MPVTVARAQNAHEEQALRHLFLDFFWALSAYDPNIALNEWGLPMWLPDGPPGPRTLEEAISHNWWIRDRCLRHLIRSGEQLVGFANVCRAQPHMPPEVEWELLDFYIAPPFRRQGLGRKAAEELFGTHPGCWQLFVLERNQRARAFWRAVVGDYTGGAFDELGQEELRFVVGAR